MRRLARCLRTDDTVRDCDPRPILVISRDLTTANSLVNDLRELGRIAVYIDACEAALEMMGVADFAVVIVNIVGAADWDTCRRIAAATVCPVAVVGRFVARDRRYRKRAFRAEVAAYICEPCTKARLREMLMRLSSGETGVELVQGASYYQM